MSADVREVVFVVVSSRCWEVGRGTGFLEKLNDLLIDDGDRTVFGSRMRGAGTVGDLGVVPLGVVTSPLGVGEDGFD